jgi:hypothetical protein
VKGADGLIVPETVWPLAGFDNIGDDEGEAEVHFTVALADEHAFHPMATAIRDRGWRVKTAMVIPETLARAGLNDIWAWDTAELDVQEAEALGG